MRSRVAKGGVTLSLATALQVIARKLLPLSPVHFTL